MTIAAHIDTSKDNPSFLLECINRLAFQNPHHHFIIFSGKESLLPDGNLTNYTHITISPEIKNSLLLHYWYNFKLPSLLKKYNATVFISENNVCSLRAKTAQFMIIQDNFLWPKKYPVQHEYRRYLKKYFSKFAEKASAVFVIKAFIGERLFTSYPVLKYKSTALLYGNNKIYNPISEEEKKVLLEKYSGTHEYFVCECTPLTQSNIKVVLKAFSIFKKRLKSGMQLVILNKMGENPIKDFNTYKYRQEVQIITNDSIYLEAKIIAASYAGIYVPDFNSVENVGLPYMQSHVPFLTLTNDNASLIYKDTAIYTDIDEKKMAEYLMLLYKDEKYRNIYIQRGAGLAGLYNLKDSSDSLWQTILQYSGV